ncbi:MAG TPA: DUF4232 domain-containing protein [Micromonosporaceae bacterium]|jgi:hypothetical protein
MARERLAIGTAAVALTSVLLAATACATTRGSASLTGRTETPSAVATAGIAVPWIDEPAAWPTSEPTPPPSAPQCAAGDLSAIASVADRRLGISQEDAANVTVTNVGHRRCVLSGKPALLSRVGTRYERVPAADGAWSSAPVATPASIGAGERAYVQLAKSIACNGGTGKVTSAGRLSLLVGRTPIPIPGLTLSGTCPGVFVGPWFTLTPERESRFTALTASIDAATDVVRGRPLTYTVALTNSSDVAVTLDPCPVYAESIGKDMALYRLNCAIGSIGPRRTVRFAMALEISAGFAAGDNVLGWQLIDPAGLGPDAVRHVTVSG